MRLAEVTDCVIPRRATTVELWAMEHIYSELSKDYYEIYRNQGVDIDINSAVKERLQCTIYSSNKYNTNGTLILEDGGHIYSLDSLFTIEGDNNNIYAWVTSVKEYNNQDNDDCDYTLCIVCI